MVDALGDSVLDEASRGILQEYFDEEGSSISSLNDWIRNDVHRLISQSKVNSFYHRFRRQRGNKSELS